MDTATVSGQRLVLAWFCAYERSRHVKPHHDALYARETQDLNPPLLAHHPRSHPSACCLHVLHALCPPAHPRAPFDPSLR